MEAFSPYPSQNCLSAAGYAANRNAVRTDSILPECGRRTGAGSEKIQKKRDTKEAGEAMGPDREL